MPKYKANRQLVGSYGRVKPGQEFVTDDKTGEELEARGLVSRVKSQQKATGPKENKAIQPESNKATK